MKEIYALGYGKGNDEQKLQPYTTSSMSAIGTVDIYSTIDCIICI